MYYFYNIIYKLYYIIIMSSLNIKQNNLNSQEKPKPNNMLEVTEENDLQFIESCFSLFYCYITHNPKAISEPDFEITMLEDIKDYLVLSFTISPFDSINYINYEKESEFLLEEYIDEILYISLKLFYITFIPVRSYSSTFIIQEPSPNKKIQIQNQLEYLKNLKQPQQRTPEWYEFRHNLITASNAYKAFESESMQNQLIYEKCKPLLANNDSNQFTNVNSPLHWGQKYEPISAMLYEEIYNTQLLELGCIQHSKYSFLGASPDGINCLESSPRYGRLLEIKNIVNREINGIPKKEYWIQMQLQMETCNLNETDFLECRFLEYENEIEFLQDGDYFVSENGEKKGIILYFSNNKGNPVYVYKPLSMTNKEFNIWQQKIVEEKEKEDYTWIKNIYWKLDEYSCVLVLRNEKWFEDNISTLQEIWDVIEKERCLDYSHREPKRNLKKKETIESGNESGCLININKVISNASNVTI